MEEEKRYGAKNIFREIMGKYFPNLTKTLIYLFNTNMINPRKSMPGNIKSNFGN
jgi:hypothetical protein